MRERHEIISPQRVVSLWLLPLLIPIICSSYLSPLFLKMSAWCSAAVRQLDTTWVRPSASAVRRWKQGFNQTYPGTCCCPSHSWWSRSPRPSGGSWWSLNHLGRTGRPSWVAPQWSPLTSGRQPAISGQLSHRDSGLNVRPWTEQRACSLKRQHKTQRSVQRANEVKMILSHIVCIATNEVWSTGSAAIWTHSDGNKLFIWPSIRFPPTSQLHGSLYTVRLCNLGRYRHSKHQNPPGYKLGTVVWLGC